MKKLEATRLRIVAIFLLYFLACTANAQYTIGQRVWTPPATGNYFASSLGGTNFPPTPFFPYDPLVIPVYSLNGSNSFLYDDAEFQNLMMSESVPPSPGEGGSNTNYPIAPAYSSYGSNDLWLEINLTNNPADFVLLTLHGTRSTNFYQLQSKTNFSQPKWALGQTLLSPNDGETDFTPVSTFARPDNFFRAQKAQDIIRINARGDGLEPTNNESGHSGTFEIFRDTMNPDSSVTVAFRLSGSATMGSDYTNIAGTNLIGTVTFPPQAFSATIFIQPILDNLIEFEESVIITLLRTNGYIVDAGSEVATNWISDNWGSNIFTVAATNLDGPAGIGYHPLTNALIVSVKSFTNSAHNFVRIDTNGVISPWSGANGNEEESKLTIVQNTTNGFTRGDIYFGTDVNGVIGRISADGTAWTNNWTVLTTDTNAVDTLLRGSLHIDQSGSFGGNLLAVTGGDAQTDGGEIWRVLAQGNASPITTITNDPRRHLEGLLSLTNDINRWGPWAGRIITGAESKFPPLVHTVATNGVVASFDLGIEPEDFDLIETNQDLYCLDQGDGENNIQPRLIKLSRTLLTNFWGQMLITQEGAQHFTPSSPIREGKLFFVQWDNSTTNFVTRRISLGILFEHATFAPITLPDL